MSDVKTLPLLPLRDIVVFPGMAASLYVGRDKSIAALDAAGEHDNTLFLVAQKDAGIDDPTAEDMFRIGTIATIIQLVKLPDGTMKVLVEGQARGELNDIQMDEDSPYFEAGVSPLEETLSDEKQAEMLATSLLERFQQYVKVNRKMADDSADDMEDLEDPGEICDAIAAQLQIKIDLRQKLLEEADLIKRLETLYAFLEDEMDVLQMEKRIRGRVKKQMEKTQREYYLNEQMKAIQNELGDGEEARDDLDELEAKIKETNFTDEARTKAETEFKKLKQMSPMSAESTVVRNYLDWLISIPWNNRKQVNSDQTQAEDVLDRDHFGLEKVKERILEYLAVQGRTEKIKGPILCLVGPPGVGKTSLGKSIAEATGRDFVRVSLGGVRDESEIRGHRRTYIGSMPGRVVQSMKKAKSSNPLFLLDEIDKLGMDYRGDPASALLEVLDPEQNSTFNDHYLEVDYDLSDVMFITTANSLNMPQPLLDRMEIIRIAGYTEDEKLEIAKRHLLPKINRDHGLKDDEWQIEDEAIRDLIRYYTREAGVRNLERELAKLARKAVREIAKKEATEVKHTADNLADYSGVKKFRYGLTDQEDQRGVVTGLAWTEVGGDLLTIEAVKMPGRGAMTVTGNLKDVMKESISAAKSFVRSRAIGLGVHPDIFRTTDIHVHVPEGATPKDGPSAGIAMVTAIVSLLTDIPVRKDIAMTGEMTLRGRVLPIGGLKEKLLAALRGGVKTVLIPEENEKDLADIPDNVKEGLTIIPVSTLDQVLPLALAEPLKPIEWSEADEAALRAGLLGQSSSGGSDEVRH